MTHLSGNLMVHSHDDKCMPNTLHMSQSHLKSAQLLRQEGQKFFVSIWAVQIHTGSRFNKPIAYTHYSFSSV